VNCERDHGNDLTTERRSAIERLVGPDYTVTGLPASHNEVFRLSTPDGEFILKCFPSSTPRHKTDRQIAEHLRAADPRLAPELVATASDATHQYHLQRYLTGSSLAALWQADSTRIAGDLEKLGQLLALLHSVPLPEDGIEPEQTLFTRRYYEAMRTRAEEVTAGIGGYLDACYVRVVEANRELPHVLVHGDYGAHQIIVGRDQIWHLTDYEFAVRGPRADDLGGCEARLLRHGVRDRAAFLAGYNHRGAGLDNYTYYREAFIAYNMLAMLTYSSSVSPADWRLLGSLARSGSSVLHP
jgi:Ser/Thr protein kinase RdoA (MazF antagonist)